jgi:hypothetical protein
MEEFRMKGKIETMQQEGMKEKGNILREHDRLCGLVVRVLGYRSGGPGSIPGTTPPPQKKRKK